MGTKSILKIRFFSKSVILSNVFFSFRNYKRKISLLGLIIYLFITYRAFLTISLFLFFATYTKMVWVQKVFSFKRATFGRITDKFWKLTKFGKSALPVRFCHFHKTIQIYSIFIHILVLPCTLFDCFLSYGKCQISFLKI